MQKRLLPMTIIALALGIVGTGLYLVPASRDDMPRRILYDNAGGTVVFEHARHVTAVAAPSGQERNCAACHHESPVARDKPVACASCHSATFDESFRKKHVAAFNDNAACATCHHRELDRKKWGHKRHVRTAIILPTSNPNRRIAPTVTKAAWLPADRPGRRARLPRWPTPCIRSVFPAMKICLRRVLRAALPAMP